MSPPQTAHLNRRLLLGCLNVLEWLSLSPDLNLIKNLWHNLKIAVNRREPSNLKAGSSKPFSFEEWEKIPEAQCDHVLSHICCAISVQKRRAR